MCVTEVRHAYLSLHTVRWEQQTSVSCCFYVRIRGADTGIDEPLEPLGPIPCSLTETHFLSLERGISEGPRSLTLQVSEV